MANGTTIQPGSPGSPGAADMPPAAEPQSTPPPPAPPEQAAAAPPTPPSAQQLNKITSEVRSFGVKLPADLLDEQGNIKPEKVADAKKFIAAEAAKRKKSDVGAAARIYERALQLDPQDNSVRMDLVRAKLAWAGKTQDHQAKKQLLTETQTQVDVVLRHEPKNWEAMQLKGKVLFALDQKPEARKCFEQAYRQARASGATEESQQAIIEDLKKAGYRESEQTATNDDVLRRPYYLIEHEVLIRIMDGIDRHMDGVDTSYVAGADATRTQFSNTPTPTSKLVDAMKAKGVLGLQVNPDKPPTSADYLKYAFDHYSEFQKEIEGSFGKLPFNSDGKLDPATEKQAREALKKHAAELRKSLEARGLKFGTPEFKIAAAQESEKPENDYYRNLGKLLKKDASLKDKAAAFFKIQAEDQKNQGGKVMMGVATEEDQAKAAPFFLASAEASEKAFALSGDPKDAKAAAGQFYAAGALARKAGNEYQAKELILRGVTCLQGLDRLPGDETLMKDGEALMMLADGLREAGLPKEAVQVYDQAYFALLPSAKGLPKHEAFAKYEAFRQQLKQRVEFSKKQYETDQKIGEKFFSRLNELEKKQAEGKLRKNEAIELSQMQLGLNLLRRTNGLKLPGKPDEPEPPVLGRVRDQVVEALKMPIDAAKLEAASQAVTRLEGAAQDLKAADAARQQFLAQFPPYVQEYVKKTGDWSVVRLDYSDGQVPPGSEWNANILQDLPVLKAYRAMKANNAPECGDLEKAVAAFQNPNLIPEGISDLNTFETEVGKVAKLTLRTDPKSGRIPVDPTSGEKVYEGLQAFGVLMNQDMKIQVQDNPNLWIRNGIEDSSQQLKQIQSLLAEMKKAKAEVADLEQKLNAAKKAGDQQQVDTLSRQLETTKKQMAKVAENARALIQAQSRELRARFGSYFDKMMKLGLLDHTGYPAFYNDVNRATQDLNVLDNRLSKLDADPEKALDQVMAGLQVLAGSHSVHLKTMAFNNAALVRGWRGTYTTGFSPWEDGQRQVNKAMGQKELKGSDWDARMKANGGYSFLLGEDEIGKALKGVDGYVRQTDQDMFKDLPTSLREGIDGQIAQLEEMKRAKENSLGGADLAGGNLEIAEYDKLIFKYLKAKEALDRGNLSKALSLFKLATDSKHQSAIAKDFERFQTVETVKTLALEVTIITAVTIMTAGTMALLAPGATAAVAAGTASTELVLGMAVGEAALFVAYEKGLRGGLYYGAGIGASPFKDAEGHWLTPVDYGWEVAKMALMLKFLHQAGEFYQAFRLEGKVMADTATKALVEDAFAISPRMGRAVLRQQIEAEVAKMSRVGRVLHGAGAFGTEAAAMQAWSNIAAVMDTMYQNTVHDKKLDWTEEIAKANSPEAAGHGLAMLAGLKLGGLAARPVQEAVSARTTEARAKVQAKIQGLDAFLRRKAAIQAKLDDPNFIPDGKFRQESIDFIKEGNALFDTKGKRGKSFFSEGEKAGWQEARSALGLLIGHSAAREKALTRSFENNSSVIAVPTKDGKWEYKRMVPGLEKPLDATEADYNIYTQWVADKAHVDTVFKPITDPTKWKKGETRVASDGTRYTQDGTLQVIDGRVMRILAGEAPRLARPERVAEPKAKGGNGEGREKAPTAREPARAGREEVRSSEFGVRSRERGEGRRGEVRSQKREAVERVLDRGVRTGAEVRGAKAPTAQPAARMPAAARPPSVPPSARVTPQAPTGKAPTAIPTARGPQARPQAQPIAVRPEARPAEPVGRREAASVEAPPTETPGMEVVSGPFSEFFSTQAAANENAIPDAVLQGASGSVVPLARVTSAGVAPLAAAAAVAVVLVAPRAFAQEGPGELRIGEFLGAGPHPMATTKGGAGQFAAPPMTAPVEVVSPAAARVEAKAPAAKAGPEKTTAAVGTPEVPSTPPPAKDIGMGGGTVLALTLGAIAVAHPRARAMLRERLGEAAEFARERAAALAKLVRRGADTGQGRGGEQGRNWREQVQEFWDGLKEKGKAVVARFSPLRGAVNELVADCQGDAKLLGKLQKKVSANLSDAKIAADVLQRSLKSRGVDLRDPTVAEGVKQIIQEVLLEGMSEDQVQILGHDIRAAKSIRKAKALLKAAIPTKAAEAPKKAPAAKAATPARVKGTRPGSVEGPKIQVAEADAATREEVLVAALESGRAEEAAARGVLPEALVIRDQVLAAMEFGMIDREEAVMLAKGMGEGVFGLKEFQYALDHNLLGELARRPRRFAERHPVEATPARQAPSAADAKRAETGARVAEVKAELDTLIAKIKSQGAQAAAEEFAPPTVRSAELPEEAIPPTQPSPGVAPKRESEARDTIPSPPPSFETAEAPTPSAAEPARELPTTFEARTERIYRLLEQMAEGVPAEGQWAELFDLAPNSDFEGKIGPGLASRGRKTRKQQVRELYEMCLQWPELKADPVLRRKILGGIVDGNIHDIASALRQIPREATRAARFTEARAARPAAEQVSPAAGEKVSAPAKRAKPRIDLKARVAAMKPIPYKAEVLSEAKRKSPNLKAMMAEHRAAREAILREWPPEELSSKILSDYAQVLRMKAAEARAEKGQAGDHEAKLFIVQAETLEQAAGKKREVEVAQARQERAQQALLKGFAERGEKVLPNKEFAWVLVDAEGEIIRPANQAEQNAYLRFKREAQPFPRSTVIRGGEVADMVAEAFRLGLEGKLQGGEALQGFAQRFVENYTPALGFDLARATALFLVEAIRSAKKMGRTQDELEGFAEGVEGLITEARQGVSSRARHKAIIRLKAEKLAGDYGIEVTEGLGKQLLDLLDQTCAKARRDALPMPSYRLKAKKPQRPDITFGPAKRPAAKEAKVAPAPEATVVEGPGEVTKEEITQLAAKKSLPAAALPHPAEREVRKSFKDEYQKIQAEKQALAKKPDAAKASELAGREAALRERAAKAGCTLEGVPYAEEMPVVAQKVAGSILDGAFVDREGVLIPLVGRNGRVLPAGRRALREQVVAELNAVGMKVSTDNLAAVDSIIDLALTLRELGIVDHPDGISKEQFQEIIADLFLSNNPDVRISGYDLGHVPSVVEGTLRHFEKLKATKGEPVTPGDKKVMFLAALLHDAGKWDPNIRTEHGYTILASSPVNKTGRDIVVGKGKTLNEALAEQGIDPSLVKPFPGQIAIVVHHDSSAVAQRVQALVEKKVLTKEQGEKVVAAIQAHGFVSSWIINNSFAEWGFRSHVFDRPELKEFLAVYRQISAAMKKGGILLDFDSLESEKNVSRKDVKTIKAFFDSLPPEVQAIMLGDHQGQIDLGKWMVLLLMSKKNATAHELLFGNHRDGDMENTFLGVLRTHNYEQQLFSPEQGKASFHHFRAAEDWVQESDPAKPGLARAVEQNPLLKAEYDAWVRTQTAPHADKSVQEWLKSVNIYQADGSTQTKTFQELAKALGHAFYEEFNIDHPERKDWVGIAARREAQRSDERPTIPVGALRVKGIQEQEAQKARRQESTRRLGEILATTGGEQLPTELLRKLEEMDLAEVERALGLSDKSTEALVEKGMGLPRTKWLVEYLKDPQAFTQKRTAVKELMAVLSPISGYLEKETSRADAIDRDLQRLESVGLKIGLDNRQALENIWDLTQQAIQMGIIAPRGMEATKGHYSYDRWLEALLPFCMAGHAPTTIPSMKSGKRTIVLKILETLQKGQAAPAMPPSGVVQRAAPPARRKPPPPPSQLPHEGEMKPLHAAQLSHGNETYQAARKLVESYVRDDGRMTPPLMALYRLARAAGPLRVIARDALLSLAQVMLKGRDLAGMNDRGAIPLAEEIGGRLARLELLLKILGPAIETKPTLPVLGVKAYRVLQEAEGIEALLQSKNGSADKGSQSSSPDAVTQKPAWYTHLHIEKILQGPRTQQAADAAMSSMEWIPSLLRGIHALDEKINSPQTPAAEKSRLKEEQHVLYKALDRALEAVRKWQATTNQIHAVQKTLNGFARPYYIDRVQRNVREPTTERRCPVAFTAIELPRLDEDYRTFAEVYEDALTQTVRPTWGNSLRFRVRSEQDRVALMDFVTVDGRKKGYRVSKVDTGILQLTTRQGQVFYVRIDTPQSAAAAATAEPVASPIPAAPATQPPTVRPPRMERDTVRPGVIDREASTQAPEAAPAKVVKIPRPPRLPSLPVEEGKASEEPTTPYSIAAKIVGEIGSKPLAAAPFLAAGIGEAIGEAVQQYGPVAGIAAGLLLAGGAAWATYRAYRGGGSKTEPASGPRVAPARVRMGSSVGAPRGFPEIELEGERFSVAYYNVGHAYDLGRSHRGQVTSVVSDPGNPRMVWVKVEVSRGMDPTAPREEWMLHLRSADGVRRGDQLIFHSQPPEPRRVPPMPTAARNADAVDPGRAGRGDTVPMVDFSQWKPVAEVKFDPDGDCIIGRQPGTNGAVIPDRLVSHRHIQLRHEGAGHFTIEDILPDKHGHGDNYGVWVENPVGTNRWVRLGSNEHPDKTFRIAAGRQFALGSLRGKSSNPDFEDAVILTVVGDGRGGYKLVSPTEMIDMRPPGRRASPPREVELGLAAKSRRGPTGTVILKNESAEGPEMVARKLVQQDMMGFNHPHIVDIPGLTRELEREFLEGVTVRSYAELAAELGQGPESDVAKMGIRKIRQGSGTGTEYQERADEATYQAYKAWVERMSFASSTPEEDVRASQDLKNYAGSRGLALVMRSPHNSKEDFVIPSSHAHYVQKVLQGLPPSLLEGRAADGSRYFKGIVFYGHRVGGATASAFEDGYVFLYQGVMMGPRRNFLGLLLHEIGHSISHRYDPSGPSDSQVSAQSRANMRNAIAVVTSKESQYALDWMGGEDYRKGYVASPEEFLAEFNLHYVVDGDRLRRHIASIKDPQAQQAYQFIYNELKKTVYDGVEYSHSAA